jgi:hypothetical protein
MTSSIWSLPGFGRASVQRAVVVLDRGLGLNQAAVRNASRAVAADRVAAIMRADAAAVIAAQPVRLTAV